MGLQAEGASAWSLLSTMFVGVPAAIFGGYLRTRCLWRSGRALS
jgi:hypothetical protein